MELKPSSAKITDLVIEFDPAPMATPIGSVLWATVRIEYTLVSLSPYVVIRVPVPFERAESETERQRQALRYARLLIDHACRAASLVPEEADAGATMAAPIEEIVPSSFQGVSQELGLAKPTVQPRPSKRAKS